MARRTRTARSLAQRIDLAYFTRPHPFRRWLGVLSIAAPAAAVLWVSVTSLAGRQTPYSGGPMAAPHAPFAQRCERCHVVRAGKIATTLDDRACLACHDAPAHKQNQTFTPSCASCHTEHRGRVSLSAVSDGSCLQCHRSLRTTDGVHRVSQTLGPFPGTGHPDFAAVRPGARDRTVLRFNHQLHLKRDLAGLNGSATLECAACHRMPSRRAASGLMPRITFAGDCASCHPLYFDPLIADQAPHGTPDAVHGAVVDALRAYIAGHPEQIGRPDQVRRLPLNFPTPAPVQARTADEWVEMRTQAAERLLWSKTCAKCHDFAPAAAALPSEIPTNMPSMWMPHARFDHRAHQLATCTSCHAAQTSRETADVLLPSIATCRRCHSSTQAADATTSQCFECHQYHEWSKAAPIRNGAFDLKMLGH
jgi:hypothetical protein